MRQTLVVSPAPCSEVCLPSDAPLDNEPHLNPTRCTQRLAELTFGAALLGGVPTPPTAGSQAWRAVYRAHAGRSVKYWTSVASW